MNAEATPYHAHAGKEGIAPTLSQPRRYKFYFLFFLIVYCKLQSTQLDRVISKVEVRKGREAGTIHRWFTGVVLLS